MTDKFRNRKLVQKVKQVIDSVDQMAGEDGEAVLPLFISESISDYYYLSSPELKKELIRKNENQWVGIEDGTLVSQFIGSTFQEYNFYQNWLKHLEQRVCLTHRRWLEKLHNAFLMDSVYIGDHFCYRIDIIPKRAGDLAF